MRYMLMRKADARTESDPQPDVKVLAAMADYNQRMLRAGVMVSGDGLRPSREGCRLIFRDGEPRVVVGPFAPSAGLEQHRVQARLPDELNLHLTFPGTCREAMTYYAEVTGGHLEALITYGETPTAAEVPADWHDRIIHASLNLRGRRLMGADMPGEDYRAPQGARVHLEYDDEAQAAEVFRRLAEGGEVAMPFAETFWARRFGMLTDRFGMPWMIACRTGHCLDQETGGAS